MYACMHAPCYAHPRVCSFWEGEVTPAPTALLLWDRTRMFRCVEATGLCDCRRKLPEPLMLWGYSRYGAKLRCWSGWVWVGGLRTVRTAHTGNAAAGQLAKSSSNLQQGRGSDANILYLRMQVIVVERNCIRHVGSERIHIGWSWVDLARPARQQIHIREIVAGGLVTATTMLTATHCLHQTSLFMPRAHVPEMMPAPRPLTSAVRVQRPPLRPGPGLAMDRIRVGPIECS